jgi:hypothetical protein
MEIGGEGAGEGEGVEAAPLMEPLTGQIIVNAPSALSRLKAVVVRIEAAHVRDAGRSREGNPPQESASKRGAARRGK